MSKNNIRNNKLSKAVSYPKGQLLANLAFLKEYLSHYLHVSSGRIMLRGDTKINRLHLGLTGIQRFGGHLMEMSLVGFDPMLCESPKVLLTADLRHWPGLISSGAMKGTRESLENQYPYFALHLFVKGPPQTDNKILLSMRSKVFLWLTEKNRKTLSAELLQDACLFPELYFDQQIEEICKMYGAGLAFSPSLQ